MRKRGANVASGLVPGDVAPPLVGGEYQSVERRRPDLSEPRPAASGQSEPGARGMGLSERGAEATRRLTPKGSAMVAGGQVRPRRTRPPESVPPTTSPFTKGAEGDRGRSPKGGRRDPHAKTEAAPIGTRWQQAGRKPSTASPTTVRRPDEATDRSLRVGGRSYRAGPRSDEGRVGITLTPWTETAEDLYGWRCWSKHARKASILIGGEFRCSLA